MIKLRLKNLLMILGISMSIASLDAQVLENNICLTPNEIDYFLNQDLLAKNLLINDSLQELKINKQDSINKLLLSNQSELINNEKDLKTSLSNQKFTSDYYKYGFLQMKELYYKKEKWNKIWKKTILVTVVVIIVESSLIYLKIK